MKKEFYIFINMYFFVRVCVRFLSDLKTSDPKHFTHTQPSPIRCQAPGPSIASVANAG